MLSIVDREVALNRALTVILVTLLLDAVGMSLIFPILPGLLRELAGADATTRHYGALLAVYAAMQFLFSPVLGALSDRFGRRPVLLLSLAGAAADYVLMALAPSMAWLYVGRVLSGITGASMAVGTAYVTDITPEADRARRFGQMGAAMGLGFVAGPLIGGAFGEWSLRAPFVAAAVMNGLNLVLAWFALPESNHHRTSRLEMSKLNAFSALHRLQGRPALMPLVGVFAVVVLVSQVPGSLWILYGQDCYGWSAWVAGLSLACYGGLHAVSQALVTGPLVARLGERRALLVGMAADGLGFVGMGMATSGWMPFALLPLFAAGGLALPALQALLARQVGEQHQGQLQGTLASLTSLIGIAGPLVVTAAFSATQSTWAGGVWVVAAAGYLLALPMLFGRRARAA
ncbi:Tet(A)/Tet(B)/Tet(C) family tetracycline efflux MFS transporter [Roseateles cellulosilyticus]|uniref:Tet(A)/Tet(B)/Tet(C) family tetracycline efflux MFS transporter n=1 Tax=Pelomonas cellulosilytica TaxID=2906762 RepID=A0ABS8Y175_9BURK|nr:Tet(A)/Tet(B)/Tet(C) family tetracycline efflux MFS transporter [Pelomonas sp. P8]MCE4557350.1 Tet(A)/Tet(B)/Tet(C) family tetracycline efflux MFS transporter [Pelomonas sp. P8]